MDKIDQQIITLIKKKSITNQKQLLKCLSDMGTTLTQATLSRHLNRLGIHKVKGLYQATMAEQALVITGIDIAPPNMLVLHTKPGFASALAYQLDQYRAQDDPRLPKLLGTLAGDDTVLTIVPDYEALIELYQILMELGQANTPSYGQVNH